MEAPSIRANPIQVLFLGFGLVMFLIALITLFSSSASGWLHDWGKDQILVVACSLWSMFFLRLATRLHLKS